MPLPIPAGVARLSPALPGEFDPPKRGRVEPHYDAVESIVAERNIRKLSAERKDYEPVAVEDYSRSDREETDYGR